MPNHYQVVGLCANVGDDDYDLNELNGADLCELVKPMPEVFKTIVAQRPPCRYVHKETGEVHQSCNGPTADREAWRQVDLTQAELDELKATYGATTWYDWCVDHWGTKWGTYELTVEILPGDGCPVLIKFQCAWSPPNDDVMRLINRYLAEKYALMDIRWVGHNPGNGTTRVIDPQNNNAS